MHSIWAQCDDCLIEIYLKDRQDCAKGTAISGDTTNAIKELLQIVEQCGNSSLWSHVEQGVWRLLAVASYSFVSSIPVLLSRDSPVCVDGVIGRHRYCT